MFYTILNFGIISLTWSVYGYIYKELLKYLDNIEIKTLYFIFFEIIVVSFILYALVFNRKMINNFSNNLHAISAPLLFGAIFIASMDIIASFSYYNLLKKYNVVYVIPILRAISTILIALIGYYYFKESLNRNKIMGIGIIILGVYILTIDK
jgi:drug/metabolite transporter (DMT)-like permease